MDAVQEFEQAEEKALAHYGLEAQSRYLQLGEPQIRARVLEMGAGDPLILVHGGGSFGSVFAPLLAELMGHRLIVVDRPGCGLTDAFDYHGVDLRAHGVAFLESLLDALNL